MQYQVQQVGDVTPITVSPPGYPRPHALTPCPAAPSGNETAPIITEGRQPTGPSRWGCAVRIPPMPSPLPRRTLADWTPEAGDVTEWLARVGGRRMARGGRAE